MASRARTSPSPSGERLAEVFAEIRARGVRLTPQRQLILETIFANRGHLTADQILASVQERFRGVNLSTVYRNLEMLEQAGFICHAHLGHTQGMYYPIERDEHQHLVCRRCGTVEDVGIEPLLPVAEEIREQTGFDLDLAHFALFGTCRRCRSEATS